MELFERVFTFFLGVSGSYGLTILMMSFVVSLILAPFYHITGILEKREKEIRLKLQPYISKINKIKNTKIRHEHITNLYKAYNYLPIKSLRSLSSLIIQIPIFIVVYRVLNRLLANNPYTADASFWFINHLSNQDNLLYGINLLPILMTLINITSVILMTNFSKDRKQGYATAVFFMIFLYRSPAGLVLFWASNNFLNLIRYLYVYLKKTNFKNISYKLKFYSLSLSKKEYVRTYLFLISIYFLINTILTSSNVNSPTIVFLPFYLLFLLRIYDYLRVYKKLIVKPDTNNDRKTYLYLIL
jgi:membrane protein insertase Oxa1/YidC/SpoIIIJ